ncbi:MAG TPA: hypothetical protein VFN94_08785 [Nitrospiria bacterium]|nr:hypothetical protein [Nitrospiria bacterium]
MSSEPLPAPTVPYVARRCRDLKGFRHLVVGSFDRGAEPSFTKARGHE